MKHIPQKEGKKAWTKDEMNVIIKAFHERKNAYPYTKCDYFAYAFELLFLTGMRKGELLALKWSNVEEDCSRIYIKDTYQSRLGRDKGAVKNNKNRELPCNARAKSILETLKQHKTTDSVYVFESSKGKRLDYSHLTALWQGNESHGTKGIVIELVKQGKLPQYLKLHSTRATFISNQIQARFDVKTVADWVADNPETILKHYCSRNESALPV